MVKSWLGFFENCVCKSLRRILIDTHRLLVNEVNSKVVKFYAAIFIFYVCFQLVPIQVTHDTVRSHELGWLKIVECHFCHRTR